MYTTIKKEDAVKYGKLKLCYIDEINQTYLEYNREANAYVDADNRDYVPGRQEYYAYFTPIPLDKQWGDDWDDAPYEYNAEIPYDDYYDENDERIETEIVRVPFYILYDEGWSISFPKDWGGDNSAFCVRDINAGAVAWVFCTGNERKSNKGSVAIHAGCSPEEFVEKINRINEMKKSDE